MTVLWMFLVTRAAAQFFLCLAKQELKGKETVGAGVAQGEQGAGLDACGIVRILRVEAIALPRVLSRRYSIPGPLAF